MSSIPMPEGLALYLRKITPSSHGSPAALAKRFDDHGAKWVAIGGPWHDEKHRRFGLMNSVDTCKRYADAFFARDILPFIWGYPWIGHEERFADDMDRCAGEYNLGLLDPELGSNPIRATGGPGKARADAHATKLVDLMAERFAGGVVGLSTFGSGVRMRWFPLNAFTRALARRFPRRTFIGGQTYTDDGVIDRSIADFVGCIEKVGGGLRNVALVPNFGTYAKAGKKPDGKTRYRSKTPAEQDAHFLEFIDENEPVTAMIGWAENFMTPALWRSFAKMAERMERGACSLPRS